MLANFELKCQILRIFNIYQGLSLSMSVLIRKTPQTSDVFHSLIIIIILYLYLYI